MKYKNIIRNLFELSFSHKSPVEMNIFDIKVTLCEYFLVNLYWSDWESQYKAGLPNLSACYHILTRIVADKKEGLW